MMKGFSIFKVRGSALRLCGLLKHLLRSLLKGVPPHGRLRLEPLGSFWQPTLRAVPIIAALVTTPLLAYFVLSVQHAQAQQPQRAQKAPEQGPPKQAEPKPQPVQLPTMPSDDRLVVMIRSTLMALNQANATGNYTVFHEMAAPAFQESNSPARLTEIFTDLRRRNLDLSPILLSQPKLVRKPQIDANGLLEIAGFFPTAPEQVNFDLIFQLVQGRWRLYGIAANTSPVRPAATVPNAAEAAP